MHADELLADGLDKKCRDDGAVDAAGKRQQDLLVAYLLADCINLLGNERLGKLGGGDACHVVRALVGIHAGPLRGRWDAPARAGALVTTYNYIQLLRDFPCYREAF